MATRLSFTIRQLHTAAKNGGSPVFNLEYPGGLYYLLPLEQNDPALRITRLRITSARAVKGSTQVQLLSTGSWCELQPGDQIRWEEMAKNIHSNVISEYKPKRWMDRECWCDDSRPSKCSGRDNGVGAACTCLCHVGICVDCGELEHGNNRCR